MAQNTGKKLLPSGFYDLIFDEALESHKNINQILDVFLANNYKLIKTPLVEFEDSFLAENVKNSLRSVDVVSGDNLVFRKDITLQISRLLATRLSNVNLPLKICYSGDVLYAKSEELSSHRQQAQLGIEIIGCDEEKSNIEVVENAILALKSLKIEKLLIDFSLPDFLDIFLAEIEVENEENLRQAILKKDISEVEKFAGEYLQIIKEIVLSNNNLANLAAKIIENFNSEKVVKELSRAIKISEFLKNNFADLEVRFDLFGDHKTYYHNEISFEIFDEAKSFPIARGGRYKIDVAGEKVASVGATIYMNRI